VIRIRYKVLNTVMHMNKYIWCIAYLILLLNFSFYSLAQIIDTIPFQLEKGLISIKGKVNDNEVDLIMDTGAGMTATTNVFNTNQNLKTTRKTILVRDGNNEAKKIKKSIISNIEIGKFSAKNLEVISFDMPYLVCQESILLGQDFMKSLNWKFDFINKYVYVSNKPFAADSNMLSWDISFRNYRPYIKLNFSGEDIDCLIDLGYRGYLDLNENSTSISEMLANKRKDQKTMSYKSRVMGFLSTQSYASIEYFLADSILISGKSVYEIPVSMSDYKGAKLGLHFFSSFCNELIINNQEAKYYYSPKNTIRYALPNFDAGFVWDDNKLKVIEKNVSPGSSAANIEIGDEIISINGMTAQDFRNDCNLLKWRLENQAPTLEILKQDGSKMELKRTFVTQYADKNR
jgi:hypothetical protein